jgi:hypothetical protein
LIVTHDINTARKVPDNIGLLYHKHLAMFGPREMLLASDEPLGEIARRTGFYDAAHLIHVFRRVEGVAPGSYRRDRPERVAGRRERAAAAAAGRAAADRDRARPGRGSAVAAGRGRGAADRTWARGTPPAHVRDHT